MDVPLQYDVDPLAACLIANSSPEIEREDPHTARPVGLSAAYTSMGGASAVATPGTNWMTVCVDWASSDALSVKRLPLEEENPSSAMAKSRSACSTARS
ncbi:MAG: hypothetical protein ABR600_13640, partial [Actinomycetota bacterium]